MCEHLFTFGGYLKHHTVPLQVSRITVERSGHFFNSFQHNLQILAYQLPYLESMLTCIGMSWMTILVSTTQQLQYLLMWSHDGHMTLRGSFSS